MTPLPTSPGATLGYRRDGRPIRLQAGGDASGEQPPIEPAPPVVEPPAPQAPKPAPPASAQPGDAPTSAEKVEDLPDWAQKIVKDARKGEGDYRTQLRDAETKATQAEQREQERLDAIAKALGFKQDDAPPDPDELTKQLTAKDEQLTRAQQAEQSARRQSAAERAMYKHGADVEALADSRTFADKLAGLDPDEDGFAETLDTLVKTTVEANPRYKAAGPAPAASSGDFSSGPGERTPRPNGLHAAVSQWRGGR